MTIALRAAFILTLLTGCAATSEFATDEDVAGDEAAAKRAKKGPDRSGGGEGSSEKKDPVRLKFLQHNIGAGAENDPGAAGIAYTFSQIDETNPDVVMLEEVCTGQLDIIRGRYPGWTVLFSQMSEAHPGCGYLPKGQVLMTPHAIADEGEVALGDPDPSNIGLKVFTLRCGTIFHPKAERKLTACVTHLRAGGQDPEAAVAARSRQAWRIGNALKDYLDAGRPVVVAGDFNAPPNKDTLDPLYRLQRDGSTNEDKFDEADQTDERRERFVMSDVKCAANACRSGEPTSNNNTKVDHVFISHKRVAGEIRADVLGKGGSGHNLYLATAELNLDL